MEAGWPPLSVGTVSSLCSKNTVRAVTVTTEMSGVGFLRFQSRHADNNSGRWTIRVISPTACAIVSTRPCPKSGVRTVMRKIRDNSSTGLQTAAVTSGWDSFKRSGLREWHCSSWRLNRSALADYDSVFPLLYRGLDVWWEVKHDCARFSFLRGISSFK